jgi:D-tyrosyl-tRNA(Tyr) deacylase
VQRVERASVTVVGTDGARDVVGAIAGGLCVLVGVTHDDTTTAAERLADKVWFLRVLDDEVGVMNRSLADVAADGAAASVLVVSQFTLYGDTSRGRRPSWIAAEPLVDHVVGALRHRGATVATGRFRTDMRVELVNDGPVTVLLDV